MNASDLILEALSPAGLMRAMARAASDKGSQDFADELNTDAARRDALSRVDSPMPPQANTPPVAPPDTLAAATSQPSSPVNAITPRGGASYSRTER